MKTQLGKIFLFLLCVLCTGGCSAQAVQGRADSPGQERRDVVEEWALAFTSRDGERLYELAADKEKFAGWDLVDKAGETYQIGFSSPWPWNEDFRIVMDGEKAQIYYYTWVSDPSVTVWTQNVQVIGKEGEYRIRYEELREYGDIRNKKQFDEAYLIDGIYSWYGYGIEEIVEGIRYQLESGDETAWERNRVYLSPDTAAAAFLHLNGGEAQVEEMEEDNRQARITYTFPDGEKTKDIPVYAAAEVKLPGGDKAEMWVVGDKDKISSIPPDIP